MSVIYCESCQSYIDTDFDVTHCEGEDCTDCECNPDHYDDEMKAMVAENIEYERAKRAERKDADDESC